MEKKQQWGSRLGFILAAVGSAIGLGNIWRFPYMVYENGGGAFLIPYFVALLTAGIPIMIMEFSLGHKSRAGAPRTFGLLNKNWEWLGWWQTGISAVIAVYYVAIIGWSFSYMFFSLNGAWGGNPADFFLNDFLKLSSGPFELGAGAVRYTLYYCYRLGSELSCKLWRCAEGLGKGQQGSDARTYRYASCYRGESPLSSRRGSRP